MGERDANQLAIAQVTQPAKAKASCGVSFAGTAGAMAKASAQSDEDAERERKREAIRQRIAAAKAAQAGANGENLASADCVPATAAAGWAARPPADASEGLENDMARKLELGARAGADLLQHDGHRIGLAEAEGDEFWDTGASHAVQALPLPTEEPGKAEGITYKTFDTEAQMVEIVALIDKDLSEPYSIFTYRARRTCHAPTRLHATRARRMASP